MIGTAFLLPFLVTTAVADAPRAVADTVVVLPEVRVDAESSRPTPLVRVPTAFATDLAARQPGRAIESLPDLLGSVSGVSVQQYGGLGAYCTVSLRGAPPGQVSVFLDGTPLTSGAQNVVDLGALPAGAVERVEVYRGLFPLGLGAGTPGGALNIVTRTAPGPLDLRATRGSFGTWEGLATGGFARGPFAASLHAGYQGSDGDFRYLDDNGTPFNAADDSVTRRVNDRVDAATLHANLTWTPTPGTRVALRQGLYQKAQGLPGIGAVPARNPRLVFGRALTQLEAARDAQRAWPALTLRMGLRRERQRFRDTGGELGLGRHDSRDRFGAEDAALELGWPRLPLGFAAQAAASAHAERATLADAADPFTDPPPSRRTAAGAMAGVRWRAPGGRLLLHAERRQDRVRDALRSSGVGNRITASDVTRTLDAPQAGARLRLPLGFDARANVSTSRRAPTFLELFGNQGSVQGSPTLRPERGRNTDAGLSWAGAVRGVRASAEYARFGSRAEDLIVYVRSSQSSVRATNVARARIRGEEWSMRVEAPGGAALRGAYTWQSALDEGDVPYWRGKRIPQRPGHEASATLDLPLGAWRVVARADHLGDDYLDAYNTRRAPSRTLLGASLVWTARPGLRFTLEGRNLTDRRVWDVGGFPLPGRSVLLACETRLGPAEPIRR